MGINQTVENREKENIRLALVSFLFQHYRNQIKNYKKAKSKREKEERGGWSGGWGREESLASFGYRR